MRIKYNIVYKYRMSVQSISNIVFDIKEKLTDLEYISIMDELQTLNNTKLVKTDDDVKLLMYDFLYEQFSFFVKTLLSFIQK